MIVRAEVPIENRWDVENFYQSLNDWENDFKGLLESTQQGKYWPSLASSVHDLSKPENVKKALDLLLNIERKLVKAYTYAHLRHDENIVDTKFKNAHERILSYLHAFAQESAWFQPALLALPTSSLDELLQAPILKDYHFYIEKIIRLKAHTLPPEQEKLLALAAQSLQTAHKAFSSINDADFKFESVVDSKDLSHDLTHGKFGMYIRDQDRTLRKDSFIKYHRKFAEYENTLCELLNGQVQAHLFNARARQFNSCLDAALYPNSINTAVYHALIEAVHDGLPVLHRYMSLRQRILKLDEQHLYDIYVPLTAAVDIRMPYQEAEALVIESVAPLGAEYQQLLAKGLQEQRWVDRYENQNKRSGAYSSGCYDSFPYILMNYKNILRDVFTLAHEAGHSMHSLYSREHQPYHYSDYPIFLAEVASTFNEDLLMRLMLERCTDPHEKFFLINQKIEDIRATLFRQTMFAEFELFIHQQAEQSIPITPILLKEKYRKLNQLYFGPNTIIDDEIDVEWARIPHFYYDYYVFQYATGISAALALSEKVVHGDINDQTAYLNFLKKGSSQYPIESLKEAGVDMTTSAPVKSAITIFERLLDELENILEEIERQ